MTNADLKSTFPPSLLQPPLWLQQFINLHPNIPVQLWQQFILNYYQQQQQQANAIAPVEQIAPTVRHDGRINNNVSKASCKPVDQHGKKRVSNNSKTTTKVSTLQTTVANDASSKFSFKHLAKNFEQQKQSISGHGDGVDDATNMKPSNDSTLSLENLTAKFRLQDVIPNLMPAALVPAKMDASTASIGSKPAFETAFALIEDKINHVKKSPTISPPPFTTANASIPPANWYRAMLSGNPAIQSQLASYMASNANMGTSPSLPVRSVYPWNPFDNRGINSPFPTPLLNNPDYRQQQQ